MRPSLPAGFPSALRQTLYLALVAAAASLLSSLRAQATPKLRWHSDLEAARTLAHQQDKPLFVVFRCER
ncbi:MAG: hypothetical protein AB8H80_06605 [Planctomycetota bacterium]